MQTKQATEAAIGVVVLSNDSMVFVVRRDDELSEPIQVQIHDAQHAATLLLDRCCQRDLKHADPSIYIESGLLADALQAEIRTHEPAPNALVIDGLGPARGTYYNRRSELHGDFQRLVGERELVIPASLRVQFNAYAKVEERDGKIRTPSNEEVETVLGRYPAEMVAAALAAIQRPRGGTGKAAADWNPHRDI